MTPKNGELCKSRLHEAGLEVVHVTELGITNPIAMGMDVVARDPLTYRSYMDVIPDSLPSNSFSAASILPSSSSLASISLSSSSPASILPSSSSLASISLSSSSPASISPSSSSPASSSTSASSPLSASTSPALLPIKPTKEAILDLIVTLTSSTQPQTNADLYELHETATNAEIIKLITRHIPAAKDIKRATITEWLKKTPILMPLDKRKRNGKKVVRSRAIWILRESQQVQAVASLFNAPTYIKTVQQGTAATIGYARKSPSGETAATRTRLLT
ncbi:hypothetical protein [Parasitella parasitica]|uniref:Uncharacterized protein n=1 Tax=Parasitella parasitica TaxID=35722 RepID=A0A0B7MU56_9FUNG|nr:hypothetical protein [Parasitella parasitica]